MIRIKWALCELKWLIIGALHVITGRYFYDEKRYGRYPLYDKAAGNDELYKHISGTAPFAYCRYSYTEMEIMIHATTQRLFGIPMTRVFKWLYIFCKKGESNYRGALKYTELMNDAFGQADMLGIWRNLHMGDGLLEILNLKTEPFLSRAEGVESFRYERP